MSSITLRAPGAPGPRGQCGSVCKDLVRWICISTQLERQGRHGKQDAGSTGRKVQSVATSIWVLIVSIMVHGRQAALPLQQKS